MIFLSVLGSMIASNAAAPVEPYTDDPAIVFELDYTSDIWGNVSGGTETGVRYLNNVDATLELDLNKLGIMPNTTIFLYGLYNNGEAFSGDLAGDAQVISNIEAPVEAIRLYEAWIEHEFWDGLVSLRAGLYDVNSEFDALETSSLFINSAHGIGTEIGQTGENGPSIFPITSLGARATIKLSDNWTFRSAVLDATPGDPNALKRTAVSLNDGALIFNELEYKLPKLKVIAGHWRYTNSFETFDGDLTDGNAGYYARGEAVIRGDHFEDTNAVSIFARLGNASDLHNDFQFFYSAGVVMNSALLEGDKLGLAVAIAETSAERKRTDPLALPNETAIELTYAVDISERIQLQPDIQYIISPGADDHTRKDVLAFGLRSVFRLGP
ncbi:carbohydrate porin [Hyphococcus formosus]|uniref:carbohydrate porin n=1 Tax=Hyphococcus formosus TaxID=3143534 RepID=UPI00398B3DD9